MQNGNINSTNPYNLTFTLPKNYHRDQFINGPYNIYFYERSLMPWLILRSLKNVNLIFKSNYYLDGAFWDINYDPRGLNGNDKEALGIGYGMIDSTVRFYFHDERWMNVVHVSPFVYLDSHAIFSTVKTESDHTEVLSIQGLGGLVWVLVVLTLLAVSAVSSYIGNRKKMRRESHFTSFVESLGVHAADMVNNSVACAKNLAVPLRYVRAWWLLGVTILIQFWCAGLKSDILVDDSLFIDSLEDLTLNPNIICYFKQNRRLIKFFEGKDSKYLKLRQQLRRNQEVLWKYNDKANEEFVSGKAVVMDEGNSRLEDALFKKIERNKRKLYVGKTKYEEFSTHMYFNRRLPRHIKERIDYVATRITETRQLEPHYRRMEFDKRGKVFEADKSMSFMPMNTVYLAVVFRLWIIGLSLATGTLFFEFFVHERGRKRTIYKIGRKNRATVEPYSM